MRFDDFQKMLVASLRARVRNGEFTERGLAKAVGVSQPHVHNILKGVRILSPDIGDQILQKLNLSLFDLLDPNDAARQVMSKLGFASSSKPLRQKSPNNHRGFADNVQHRVFS